MRRAAAALLILAAAACGEPAGSALRFDASRVDLGILHQYDEKEFTVPFRVEGDTPVTLSSIEVSCGCTHVGVEVDGKVLLLAEKKVTATGAAAPAAPAADGEETPLLAEAKDGEIVLAPGTRGVVRGLYQPGPRLNQQIVGISLRGSMLNSPARTELHAQLEPLFVLDPPKLVFGTVVDQALRAQPLVQEVTVRAARPFTLHGWKKVPAGLGIEDLGAAVLDDGAPARRFRFTLGSEAPLGTVAQMVGAGTDLGHDLELLVTWRVVGPATYAPDHRVSFVAVPYGKAHERGVKVRPSLPDLRLPEPRAEILGDAAAVVGTAVEALPAEADQAAGWLVRCTLAADAPAGSLTGTLRISYPDDPELTPHEMIVNIRVQEPR